MNCYDCNRHFRRYWCQRCKEWIMDRCGACHADTDHDPVYWDDDEIEDMEDEWDVPLPPSPPKTDVTKRGKKCPQS